MAALTPTYTAALKILQAKDELDREMAGLDTTTLQGDARRTVLQSKAEDLYAQLEQTPIEAARIISIVYDSLEPELTLASLTPVRLATLLA